MSQAIIDLDDLLYKIGGEEELVRELLTMFLEDNQNTLSELRSLLEAQNWHEAHQLAHTLKGTAGNLSAVRLFESAKVLDDSIRDQRIDHWPELLARVTVDLQEFVAFSKSYCQLN